MANRVTDGMWFEGGQLVSHDWLDWPHGGYLEWRCYLCGETARTIRQAWSHLAGHGQLSGTREHSVDDFEPSSSPLEMVDLEVVETENGPELRDRP